MLHGRLASIGICVPGNSAKVVADKRQVHGCYDEQWPQACEFRRLLQVSSSLYLKMTELANCPWQGHTVSRSSRHLAS